MTDLGAFGFYWFKVFGLRWAAENFCNRASPAAPPHFEISYIEPWLLIIYVMNKMHVKYHCVGKCTLHESNFKHPVLLVCSESIINRTAFTHSFGIVGL